MQSFFYLFTRYLSERAKSHELCAITFPADLSDTNTDILFRVWDRIKSPAEDQIVPYSKLPNGDASNLSKLAVLKVNGGLGTSMGEHKCCWTQI